jgi:hypothetical protein
MSFGVTQPMAYENSTKRVAIVLFLILAPSSALADAIDGDWCSPDDARQFRIAGASITTPAGTQTTGNYSRHAFSYVVPFGDAGAGDEIDMQLLNEEEVQVVVGRGPPEVWRRCHLNV